MNRDLVRKAWARALNPPPLPPRPRLSRAGALAILKGYEKALTEQLAPFTAEDLKEDHSLAHLNAMRGFLRGAQSRLERGHDPLVVLDYKIIEKITDRDVVALVRTGLTTGFNRPHRGRWGWQVVDDEIRWVSYTDWVYYEEMQT